MFATATTATIYPLLSGFKTQPFIAVEGAVGLVYRNMDTGAITDAHENNIPATVGLRQLTPDEQREFLAHFQITVTPAELRALKLSLSEAVGHRGPALALPGVLADYFANQSSCLAVIMECLSAIRPEAPAAAAEAPRPAHPRARGGAGAAGAGSGKGGPTRRAASPTPSMASSVRSGGSRVPSMARSGASVAPAVKVALCDGSPYVVGRPAGAASKTQHVYVKIASETADELYVWQQCCRSAVVLSTLELQLCAGAPEHACGSCSKSSKIGAVAVFNTWDGENPAVPEDYLIPDDEGNMVPAEPIDYFVFQVGQGNHDAARLVDIGLDSATKEKFMQKLGRSAIVSGAVNSRVTASFTRGEF